jgi:GNAT superfamily N-acetyltransferase
MGRSSIREAIYARVMSRVARHAGVRVFRIFDRRLDLRTAPTVGGLEYRLLQEGEVVALSADASLGMTQHNVRAAYARGDVCLGAFDGGRLAAYCWFAFSPAPHMDHAWVEFPADVVYTYKSYVVPAYRGRGVAATLYRYPDRIWLRRGRTQAMLCVESHNFASIAAARRAGFSPTGYAAYVGSERLHAWRSGRVIGCGMRFYAPAT